MNLYLLLPILTPLFRLCYAWQLPQSVLDLFQIRSRVPQFIRDTQHPWLEENRSRLERLEDPEYSLCSLDSDIRPGYDSTPPELFKRLEINNNRWGVDRAGWGNAAARINEMLRCPAAMNGVKELQVEIWIHRDIKGVHDNPIKAILQKESSNPDPKLANSFVELLLSMPNLECLQWETFGHGNAVFRKAFLNANVTLPFVKHLRPAHNTEVLVGLCPNLKSLEAGRYSVDTFNRDADARLNLLEAARNAKSLKHFSMDGGWSLQFLKGEARAMQLKQKQKNMRHCAKQTMIETFQTIPNITSLEIGGGLRESPYSYGPFSEPEGNILNVRHHPSYLWKGTNIDHFATL
jgi:hypothetical protein